MSAANFRPSAGGGLRAERSAIAVCFGRMVNRVVASGTIPNSNFRVWYRVERHRRALGGARPRTKFSCKRTSPDRPGTGRPLLRQTQPGWSAQRHLSLFLEATQLKTVPTVVEGIRGEPIETVEIQVVDVATRCGRRPTIPVLADAIQRTRAAVAIARSRVKFQDALRLSYAEYSVAREDEVIRGAVRLFARESGELSVAVISEER